jgi:tetratricopeptide (TPR) repeat protein
LADPLDVQLGRFFFRNLPMTVLLSDSSRAFGHQTANQEANVENAGAYVERGIANQNKGDLDGAMADQNQAIQLNPINAIAYTNRRLLLYKIIYNIDLSF